MARLARLLSACVVSAGIYSAGSSLAPVFGDHVPQDNQFEVSMKWLGQMKVSLFPPVTRRMALDIASRVLGQSDASEPLICHGRMPKRFSIYANLPEPCWWVQVPWNNKEVNALRSSRVIVVGRQTGKVLYDGPAGDEG